MVVVESTHISGSNIEGADLIATSDTLELELELEGGRKRCLLSVVAIFFENEEARETKGIYFKDGTKPSHGFHRTYTIRLNADAKTSDVRWWLVRGAHCGAAFQPMKVRQ